MPSASRVLSTILDPNFEDNGPPPGAKIILLVEASAYDRLFKSADLIEQGYYVYAVESGAEAKMLLSSDNFKVDMLAIVHGPTDITVQDLVKFAADHRPNLDIRTFVNFEICAITCKINRTPTLEVVS